VKGVFTDQFRLAADAAKGPMTVGEALWKTYCPEPVVAKPKEKLGGDPERKDGQSEKMDIATERLRKLGKPARTQEQEFDEIDRLIIKVERQCIVDSVIEKVLKGE
jgi:hypothetical protein